MTVAAFRETPPFGRDLVANASSCVVVDLARNAAGVDDALAIVKRPFVVSHSACRAVQDHRAGSATARSAGWRSAAA
jgi:microsomal dipeptidase-like Zn-dependent dipeptidase